MNKIKLSVATVTRAFLNAFFVMAMVALASLIGIGGAALWIYNRPVTPLAAATPAAAPSKATVADAAERVFPMLTPVESESDSPAQLTPARYVPTAAEIATVSDTPRYTYVSYNGGRQQAHLRVNTVLSTSVPAPLAPVAASYDENNTAPVPTNDRGTLSDSASHYITDIQGRVIGIDGTAGAVAEARAQRVTTARSTPVAPEVRVASPVVVRKATPVDDEDAAPATEGFSVQAELAHEDDRPVLRAQPVARSTRSSRPSMFGAADDFRSFGSN